MKRHAHLLRIVKRMPGQRERVRILKSFARSSSKVLKSFGRSTARADQVRWPSDYRIKSGSHLEFESYIKFISTRFQSFLDNAGVASRRHVASSRPSFNRRRAASSPQGRLFLRAGFARLTRNQNDPRTRRLSKVGETSSSMRRDPPRERGLTLRRVVQFNSSKSGKSLCNFSK